MGGNLSDLPAIGEEVLTRAISDSLARQLMPVQGGSASQTVVTATVAGGRAEPEGIPLRDASFTDATAQEAFERGKTHSRQGRFREAAAAYEEVLRCAPDSYAAHFNLGFAYGRLGDARKAVEHFQRAAELRPQDADAYYCMVLPHALLGDVERAEEDLGRALAYGTNLSAYAQGQVAWVHYFLGWRLVAEGQSRQGQAEALDRLKRAERHFKEALELHARDFEPLYALGAVSYEIGRRAGGEEREAYLRRAVSLFTEALSLMPASSAAHNDLGIVHHELGDVEAAVACYEKAVELDQGNLAALHNLGNTHLAGGRAEETLKYSEQARRLNPDDPEALNQSGAALLSLGRLDEAEGALARLLRLNPDSVNGHINLGAVRFKRDQFDEAKESFARALELDPANQAAQHNLQLLSEQLLERKLFELGYLSEIPEPVTDLTPYRDRTPIPVQGKPLSEFILEDRR